MSLSFSKSSSFTNLLSYKGLMATSPASAPFLAPFLSVYYTTAPSTSAIVRKTELIMFSPVYNFSLNNIPYFVG